MTDKNDNFKLIFAVAIGAIGGLMLGNYLWGDPSKDRSFAKHVDTLSKILQEIEGIKSDEANDLKSRINSILKTIESKYGNN